MARKILLLGGMGAIGRHLSRFLVEMGDDVYVTTRTAGRHEKGVTFLCGNAKSLSCLRQFILDVRPDVIVDFMIYSTKEFAERFQVLLSGSRQYIFFSSYRVFASDCPLTENSRRILDTEWSEADFVVDDYPLEKARQENILRGASNRSWTIIRPAITYAEDRFQLGCMESDVVCYRALQNVPVAMPDAMRSVETTLTYGKDVALLVSRLILNPVAYGEDYNCATAEHITWGEVCDIFGECIGACIRNIDLADYVQYCSSRSQVYYDRMVSRIIDNRKVLQATGLTQEFFTPVRTGLAKALQAFRQKPSFRTINYVEHAHLDRILHSQIALSGLTRAEVYRYLYARYACLRIPLSVLRHVRGRLHKGRRLEAK